VNAPPPEPAAASPANDPPKPHPFFWLILAAAIVIPLRFSSHWFHEDDYLYLYHYGNLSPLNIIPFFQRGPLFFWRPLQAWLGSIARHLGGLNPRPVNIFMTIFWGLLVYRLERFVTRLCNNRPSAGVMASAVFLAMSPMIMMTHFWLSLWGVLLGAVLLLAALESWIGVVMHPSAPSRTSWKAALLLTLAVLGKESLAVGLLPVILMPWALRRSLRRIPLRHLLPWLIPLATALAAVAVDLLQPATGLYQSAYHPAPPATALLNPLRMLNALIWPLGGAAADIWPTRLHTLCRHISATYLFLPPLLLLPAFIRRRRTAAFFILWSLAACFPAALFTPVYPRYLFPVSLPLAAVLGCTAADLLPRLPQMPRRLVGTLLVAYMVICLATWYLLLAYNSARFSYGKRLAAVMHDLAHSSPQPTLFVIRGLNPQSVNRGLGLDALARLATERDDVSCALPEDLRNQRAAGYLSVTYPHRIYLTYNGIEFLSSSPPPDQSHRPQHQ